MTKSIFYVKTRQNTEGVCCIKLENFFIGKHLNYNESGTGIAASIIGIVLVLPCFFFIMRC